MKSNKLPLQSLLPIVGLTFATFIFNTSALLVALCILWGISGTAYNVSMQSEVINLTVRTPEATSVAMAIFSGIFNMGIGFGSYAGGLVCTHLSIRYIGFAGAAVTFTALLYWTFRLSSLFDRARQ